MGGAETRRMDGCASRHMGFPFQSLALALAFQCSFGRLGGHYHCTYELIFKLSIITRIMQLVVVS